MSDFQPIPITKRIFVGPDRSRKQLLAEFGFRAAEYRGTDLDTGDEYWQMIEPPIAFVFRPKSIQIVVHAIGEDPDQ